MNAQELAEQYQEPLESPKLHFLKEWLDYIQAEPEYINWRNRFYWEQRVTGWLATIEQSLDLLPSERFYPANARESYAMMICLPVDDRRKKRHEVGVISRLAPEFLEIPFDPRRGRKLRHWYRRTRADPFYLPKRMLWKVRRFRSSQKG